jgi:hypothetical protein
MGKASRRKHEPFMTSPVGVGTASNFGTEPDRATTWLPSEAPTSMETLEDAEDAQAVSTPAGLLHSVLVGGVRLTRPVVGLALAIAWVLFAAWVFLQDNGAGKIQTWEGLRWFSVKVLAFGVLALPAATTLLLCCGEDRK